MAYYVSLTWKIRKGGVPTCIADPVDPKRRIRLIGLRLIFSSVFGDGRCLIQANLKGASGVLDRATSKFPETRYDFIHHMFGRGLTAYDVSQRTMFIQAEMGLLTNPPILGAKRAIVWLESNLGVKVSRFGEPRISGQTRGFILGALL